MPKKPPIQSTGNPAILARPKLALFCSVKCPGKLILQTYDTVQAIRAQGITVISPFHSPMEKECLRILLRASNPIIWGLARSLYTRVPTQPIDCRPAVEEGTLVFVSPFKTPSTRITAETATIRNRMVADLADAIFIAHAAPEGKILPLALELLNTGKPVYTFDHPDHAPLIAAGAKDITAKFKELASLFDRRART